MLYPEVDDLKTLKVLGRQRLEGGIPDLSGVDQGREIKTLRTYLWYVNYVEVTKLKMNH